MKLFRAVLLSCCFVFVYGGAPPQDGPDGAGSSYESTEATSQQNCLQVCASQSKCASSSDPLATFGTIDQRCRECIQEDCDAMSSTDDVNAMCGLDSYTGCETCPALDAETERNYRVCRTCLRKCSDRGRRPGRRPGRGPKRFNLVRGFFGTFRCMKSCQAPDKCPTRQEVRAQLFASRRECRECVMETCGPFVPSNRTDVEDCIIGARQDCTACPLRTQQQQMRMGNCKRCIRNCGPRRGNAPHRPGLVRKPFQRMSCMANCQSETTCPTITEVTNRMEGLSHLCRECISEECGPFTRYNMSEVMGCVSRARRGCIDCPITTLPQQVRIKRCKSCGRRCFRESFGGFRPGPFGRGPRRRPGMLPLGHLSCLLSCQSPSKCPTKTALIGRLTSTSGPCRACLEEECGEFDSNPSNEVMDCLQQARRNCDSCPVITTEEQQNLRSCRSCIRGCLPGDVRRGGPGYGGPRRGGPGYGGPRRGGPGHDGPRRGGPGHDGPRRGGPGHDGPRRGGPGHDGPRRGGPGHDGPRRGGPGRYGSARGEPRPKPRHGLAQYFCITDCARNSCPARPQALNMLQATSQECRTCILTDCGSYQESDGNQFGDCIIAAREECSECPTLSSEEQERARTCRSCIHNCTPQRGSLDRGFVPRGIRRGIFRTMACLNGCQSTEMCPALDEIRNRLTNTRRECRQCVEEECGDFSRSNRSEVAECISNAQDNCEECPTLTDQDQRRRRRCVSCAKGCLPFRGGFMKRRRRFHRKPMRMLSCMRQCSSEGVCPSRRDFMNRFIATPKSCRMCVMDECGRPGSFDGDSDNTMADCIDEAQEECSGCPDVSEEDQRRRRTCRSCVNICLSRRDDCDSSDEISDPLQTSTQTPPPTTPAGLSNTEMCVRSCQSSSLCVNAQNTMSTTSSAAACLTCVGQSGCNQYPVPQRRSCLLQARASCSSCLTVPPPNRFRNNHCRICIARCSRQSPPRGGGPPDLSSHPGYGRPGRGGRGPGGNIRNPFS